RVPLLSSHSYASSFPISRLRRPLCGESPTHRGRQPNTSLATPPPSSRSDAVSLARYFSAGNRVLPSPRRVATIDSSDFPRLRRPRPQCGKTPPLGLPRRPLSSPFPAAAPADPNVSINHPRLPPLQPSRALAKAWQPDENSYGPNHLTSPNLVLYSI